MYTNNRVAIRGKSQIQVSIDDGSDVVKHSGLLQVGTYDVWSDVDVHIRTGTIAMMTGLSDANGYFIAAGNSVPVAIEMLGDVIGAVCSSTGTLSIHKVD